MWSLCITLLILGFTSGVRMETCPEEEDIYPCVCHSTPNHENTKIAVLCTDPTLNLDSLKKALSSLSGKNSIDLLLGKFQLGKLPSNFFSGIGITKLAIDKCPLDSLTNDDQPGLIGLENHLEELLIDGSFTEGSGPTKLSLGHLKKLKKLTLMYNKITELGDDWFSNGPFSLELLEFYNNKIPKIGNNAFAELNNLRSLSVSANLFGTIKRSMFPRTAEKLEVLELDRDGLSDIPEDLFSQMPSIHTVSLRENELSTLDEKTWSPIWQQLGSIGLETNNLNCDDKLNWILKFKDSPRIYGNCKTPEEFKGMELGEYLKSRSQ